MSSPYHIEGPALISFSGGRTSAYMLHEIVRLAPSFEKCRVAFPK